MYIHTTMFKTLFKMFLTLHPFTAKNVKKRDFLNSFMIFEQGFAHCKGFYLYLPFFGFFVY